MGETKTKRILSFATGSNDNENSPVSGQPTGRGPKYKSTIIKEEFRALANKWTRGANWVRIIPGFQTFSKIKVPGGDFGIPTGHDPENPSWGVISAVFKKAKEHYPDFLDSLKANKDLKGMFWPKAWVAFWCIRQNAGDEVNPEPTYSLALVTASANDGSRGGMLGLGHQIKDICFSETEPGVRANAVDPASGNLICVTKTQGEQAEFPSYQIKLGTQAAPLETWAAKIPAEQAEGFVPPIEALNLLTGLDEQLEALKPLLPTGLYEEVKAQLK